MADLNWDFHCHSTASDGTLPAAEVARRAADNGVNLLALTDHDDLSGLPAAREVAAGLGMGFVNGVEVSIEWEGTSIHVVGLGFDAEDPMLNAGLASVRGGRVERAQRMGEALEAVAIRGAFEGAMAYAGNPNLISRAHFARYLVEIGLCKDVHSVFENFLTPGKPGYVDHRWAAVEDAVGWIRQAGGVAVLAHPGRYKISNAALRRFLGQFKEVGGEGIEVVTGSHSPDQVHHFARLARHYGFLASRGSDFHGPEESYTDLGRLSSLPDDLTPLWTRFA